MQLFYYRGARPNFGDELNVWLWNRVSPGLIDTDESELLIGAGTLLAADVPSRFPAARRIHTLGSGAGYAELPDVNRPPWSSITVRGPVTGRLLGGLPESSIGTDSAILLALIPELRPLPESQRSGIVFMPHFRASDMQRWRGICARAGIEYLDPGWDSYALVDRIRRAKLVVADAMHAAIVADTMRVPWIPTVSSAHISTTKWLDWTASMRVPYVARPVPAISVQARRDDRFLGSYGESHQIVPPRLDNPEIYARFDRVRIPTRRSWFRTRAIKASSRVLSRAYERVARPSLDPDAPIQVLRELSSAEPFMSTDSNFGEKRDFMEERLRSLESAH